MKSWNSLYDLQKLGDLVLATEKELFADPQKFFGDNAVSYGQYIFIDNGANVLAVGHLDTVGEHGEWRNVGTKKEPKYQRIPSENKPALIYKTQTDAVIESIQLDDRLGVWLITDVLPRLLGNQYDILLSTNEEVGASTASLFNPDKKYNWIFEFDRRGYGNVVMYHYHTHELEKMLEAYGYDVQQGTFSDISVMDDLGCAAFNFGCGYFSEHTQYCNARLSHIHVCVAMFEEFFSSNKDKFFEHVQIKRLPNKYHYDKYDDYNYEWDRGGEACKYCGSHTNVVMGVCDYCFSDGVDLDDVKQPKAVTCINCGLPFNEDDLTDEGMCIDCLDFLFPEPKEDLLVCDGCENDFPGIKLTTHYYGDKKEVAYRLCDECEKLYKS